MNTCPICEKPYETSKPNKFGGMQYHHAGDPDNVFCQQSSSSYAATNTVNNYFEDLEATGYVRHDDLRYDFFAYVNTTWKEAIIFHKAEWARISFERGIQGRVWIDKSGAWDVEYAESKMKDCRADYLPINEVLPMLGYNVANET